MSKALEYLTNVLLIVTCAALLLVLGTRWWSGGANGQAAANALEDIEDQNMFVALDDRVSEGQRTAKVVLVEFSDFECPFCAKYVKDTYPQLRDDYVATGKIRRVFRNLPLPIHRFARPAALAAECALQQGKYWDMHARLFADQRALTDTDLRRHAAGLGLDESAFAHCLGDPVTAARIDADLEEAARLNVRSTPTFFIGEVQPDGRTKLVRRLAGAWPYAVFADAIDDVADF